MAGEGDKTEAPTPRKRAEARENGNIARSQDLTAAGMLLASVILLYILGMRVFTGLRAVLEGMLTAAHAGNPTRPDDIQQMGAFALHALATTVAPLLLAIGGVGLLAAMGPKFSTSWRWRSSSSSAGTGSCWPP